MIYRKPIKQSAMIKVIKNWCLGAANWVGAVIRSTEGSFMQLQSKYGIATRQF